MFRNLFDSPSHLMLVALVVVVVFGWKKLPDAARSLGRSMRIFKSEVEEMKKDGKPTSSAASSDTVKGETVHPTTEPNANPAWSPTTDQTADAVSDPAAREKHNQPPA
jgi:sec-independent protein translocase protein TatA